MKKILAPLVVTIFLLPSSSIAAIITITTDAELVEAHQSLPDANDIFIQAVVGVTDCPGGSILHDLFCVFKQAVDTQNSDVDYFMNRLKDMNDIGQAMSDYLQDLANSSSELQDKLRGSYLTELGVDAGFESTEDLLFFALYDSDNNDSSPISVVVDASSDETGGVNALMRSYGVPISYTSISEVPIPATVWLFGTVLIGLVGFARRSNSA